MSALAVASIGDYTGRFDASLEKRKARYARFAAHHACVEQLKREAVSIETYAPFVSASSRWLSAVEARIRDSVLIDEYGGEPSAEWLSEDVAAAAIAFFRYGADLLPVEPHIYASNSGDLVAEFETSSARMTSIVSATEAILFAVLTSSPTKPLQARIQFHTGSFREELRSFTKNLNAASHGKMDTTRHGRSE